jgi:acyl carrier protein
MEKTMEKTMDGLIPVVARAIDVTPEAVGAETEFRKCVGGLGVWDSFAALALVYGIEAEFGVRLGYGVLAQVTTIGELAAAIEARRPR